MRSPVRSRRAPATVSAKSKSPSPTSRKRRRVSAARQDYEAAVGEVAEAVAGVHAAEHGARAFAPRQGLGAGDAVVYLEDPTLEHAVFGPRARKVLGAGHLHPRHLAGRRELAGPVAVRVAGEVADKSRAPDEHIDEQF